MFCNNCGKEVPEGTEICESCQNSSIHGSSNSGAGILQQMNSLPDFQNDLSPKKGSKKLLKVLLVAAIALIALSGVAFGAFSVIEMLKSPKQLYLEIEAKNLESNIEAISEKYQKEYEEQIKPMLDKNYQSKVEFSVGADLKNMPGIDPDTAQKVSELLGKLKIESDIKANPVKKQYLTDFKLFIKDTQLIKSTILMNDKKIGINVPDFYSKYLVVDGSDLKSLYKNLGVSYDENIPNKIIENKDIIDAIKIDDNVVKALLKKYGKLIYDSIDEKSIVLERNVAFEANGEQIKSRKFTITLDENTLKSFMIKMYDEVSNDDSLFEITYGNFLNVVDVYRKAGYFTESDEELEELFDKVKAKQSFKESKEQFIEGLNELKLPNGIKMTLWADSKKHILGRKIDILVDSNDEPVNISFNSKHWTKEQDNSKNNVLELAVAPQNNEGKLALKCNTQSLEDGKNTTDKAQFEFAFSETSGNTSAFKLDLVSKVNKPEGKQNLKLDFLLKQNDEEFKGAGEVDIKTASNNKNKSRSTDYAVKFDLTPPGASEKQFSGNINLKEETTFDIDFTLPEVTSSNSVSLNTASQEELQGVMQEVYMSVQKFVQNNQELFNSLMEY
ncbi:MAG: hypothetical protein N3B21_04675 [Clostridia bacterium]|nr:hypothetical protein [Clostridia bacterium]